LLESKKKWWKSVICHMGKGSYHVVNEINKPHEAGLLNWILTRRKRIYNGRPVLSAGEAIQKTVNWYKNSMANNALELIEDDIHSFMNQTAGADKITRY